MPAHGRLALVGVVVSAPVLLVLLPGDWFDENAVGALDREMEPLDLPLALHVGLAVMAAAALVACLLGLLRAARQRSLRRDDVAVAVPLLLAGLYAAFTYRVTTAAVTGANIGAGMLFLFGLLLVPAMIALAVRNARVRRDVS